jgi:D-sedoheptulose 7-phosphate isomerase
MEDTIRQAIDTHKAMVGQLEKKGVPVIAKAAVVMAEVLKGGHRVYICGNGGSAADAQHIAGELMGRFEMTRQALPVVALTTDTSILTAIGNDLSFEDVFVRQVEALVKPGDLLWAISTSGKSPNVIKAARLAKERGATILTFTGRANSPLEQMSDLCLCADYPSSARSQEIHQLAYHILCGLVERLVCGPGQAVEGVKAKRGTHSKVEWIHG